jgi:hypothetical protein
LHRGDRAEHSHSDESFDNDRLLHTIFGAADLLWKEVGTMNDLRQAEKYDALKYGSQPLGGQHQINQAGRGGENPSLPTNLAGVNTSGSLSHDGLKTVQMRGWSGLNSSHPI